MLKKSEGLLLIIFSHTLAHIFMASLAPLLPLIRKEFDLSYTMVGAVTFILSLCFAFSSIPTGIISDKVDRIRLMATMFLLIGIVSSIMVLASTFLSVFLLLLFLFLFLGIYHPSAYPYLSDIYLEGKGEIFGLFETGAGVGRLVAPLVAGVVGAYLGWRHVYALWALFAFAIVFLLYLFLEKNRPGDRAGSEASEEKHSKKNLVSRGLLSHYPHLKTVYLTSGLFGFIVGGNAGFLPLFLTDVHKLPVSMAGAILTVFLAGGLVGNVIGGKYADKVGPKRILELGFLISSFFLLLIPFVRGFSLILILLPAGITIFMTLPALALFIGTIDTTRLGLAYGIQVLSGAGLGASSKLLCGVVSDMVGIEHIFFLLSATAFLAALLVYFGLRNKG